MQKEKEIFADDLLNNKREHYVTIPTDTIFIVAKVALVALIVTYSFGIAQGKKLAA